MAAADPNLEWLGHVQPTGLVVAPSVLGRFGLTPQEQLRTDVDAVAEFLAEDPDKPALPDKWAFFAAILGWHPAFVAGAPGGPDLPDELSAEVPEADTALVPTWAVREPDGGWQMLVRIEGRGIDPDARGALAGWEATPHQRLERLLRETGIPTGLLLTDTHVRLVYAPRGETSGWAAFPLRELATVGGRPMLGGLKLLLNATRLFSDGRERRLPNLLHASREAQAEISTKLATQVLGALHELLRGLHAADRERVERLAAQRPAHLYEGLLTVLLRLIFLLYGEDRNLLPSRADGPAQALYQEGYGVRSLHAKLLADRAGHPDTMEERRGAWGRLLALFRLVHGGDGTGWIRSRGGKLFDPGAFPFLEGRDNSDDRPAPPHVTDGCVLRVLDGLLVLGGEKLSYRTLDVQHIGSVYETVMGFTVLAIPGPALAIKAGKNNRTPVFVDLAALAGKHGKEREKFLKDEADRSGQLPARVAAALAAAADAVALAEALRPIVDERGSPHGPVPSGTPLLQPTDERRRTGSHYTPRSLTEPIVRHALEPAFERLGPDATPDQVLALKVCDPAMGSGAFLVEACRQLAARLIAAWTKHPGTRPPVAEDEDEDLLARRLVSQRCLYGVDRNPMATDLGRLSLWLATLARDHEFTFLDHALKSGDSLVGLTRSRIGALTWGDDRQDSAMSGFVRGRVAEAVKARAEIRDAPDDVARAIQEARHRALEARMADVRALGDAVLACFFRNDKPRAREAARRALAAMPGGDEAMWAEVRRLAGTLDHGAHPVRPFHWEIEFPEVFEGREGGFDAIVGNPPFLGGKRISTTSGDAYRDWLAEQHEGSNQNVDLCGHFFLAAFHKVRTRGAFGFVATNSISQGDTREGALVPIIRRGGQIIRAERRLPWPGDAAVIVSVIHISKNTLAVLPMLDGSPVKRISAYIVAGETDDSPARLFENARRSFVGTIVLGSGFVFQDGADKGTSLDQMRDLIVKDPRNASMIRPYIGGEELNSDPRQRPRRYVIAFSDLPYGRDPSLDSWLAALPEHKEDWLRRGVVPLDYPLATASDFPDLLEIVRNKVRPLRMQSKRPAYKDRWWRFGEPQTAIYRAIRERKLSRVLAISQVSGQHSVAFLPPDLIYAVTCVIIVDQMPSSLGLLQSRVHEVWVRTFASSLKDDRRYTPTDCFENFPFFRSPAEDESVERLSNDYCNYRATLMVARNEGLTKTYNLFHNLSDRNPDIQRLRELHHELDLAVLRAYGWDDLAARAKPEFLTEETEPDHRYQGRLFWPASFRDEVLARLLDLNRARAAEERALGISPGSPDTAEDDQDEAA